MSNSRFHNALKRQPQAVPPIWFMRQAGRYHRHYQRLREKYEFMDLCRVPELAAEVAMGPVQDFDFDVAILFSDLLFPLQALGLGLSYEPGPVLAQKLTRENVTSLVKLAEAWPQLHFQSEALRATRERLPADKSLIGFVGGPWTLYTYAVEGGHKGDLIKAKQDLELFDLFNRYLLPVLYKNIEIQLSNEAEVVMVFDTAAGELDELNYRKRVVPILTELARRFPQRLGYYAKGVSAESMLAISEAPWAGVGVDHRLSLPRMLAQTSNGFVQGNFDQALLFADTSSFKELVDQYLAELAHLPLEQRAGWVLGLGHGVLPGTPEAHVRYLVERARTVLSS